MPDAGPPVRAASRPSPATALRRLLMLAPALLALGAAAPAVAGGRPVRMDGVNLIQDTGFPFGSPEAEQAIAALAATGASAVALVPFLWQPAPDSPEIVRGADMDDAQLRTGIRLARAAGLRVMVKPHVWVPGHWAGAVAMSSGAAWSEWFARYRDAITRLARIAAEEGAHSFSLGTEIARSTERPEWASVIDAVRAVFPGNLTYSAHWAEEVERFPFWDRLDAVSVTLYPALGADDDPAAWRAAMTGEIERVTAVARRVGRPVWVTEIGLRSAEGAALRPWESAEERTAPPDGALQARVLAVWYQMLERLEVEQVLVWRWITDPHAGGPKDTDFVIRNKPAEAVLRCLWRGRCDPAAPVLPLQPDAAPAARPAIDRTPAAAGPEPPDAPGPLPLRFPDNPAVPVGPLSPAGLPFTAAGAAKPAPPSDSRQPAPPRPPLPDPSGPEIAGEMLP